MGDATVTDLPAVGEMIANQQASKATSYSGEQEKILSDAALAEAVCTISAWPGYAVTPLVSLPDIAARAGIASVHYKDESNRFGLGSFKALGGAYAVAQLLRRRIAEEKKIALPDMEDILGGAHADVTGKITVCCATDGNHGRSVAWGARTFGCNCTIFIHATVSEGRKQAIEAYGATVIRTRGNYDDSVREAQRMADENGWYVVSDTSYPGYTEIPKFVMQGYEVMAKEADEALAAPPTHIFIQTGVGGLAAAVGAYFKRRYGADRPVLVLADPVNSACWIESYRAGKPTAVGGDLDTIMAGLACGEVSLNAWNILKDHGDAAVAVADQAAIDLMRDLARASEHSPVVAGESAVAGLAALLSVAGDETQRATLSLGADARVLVFGTEGDTDPELYAELVGRSSAEVRKGVVR